jgi:hypothetical protein
LSIPEIWMAIWMNVIAREIIPEEWCGWQRL